MALPNIFHGTTVLAPGEAGNKNQNWLCDGRTQFYWLRYAQALAEEEDTRASWALAIATGLQMLDAAPVQAMHEEDPEETAHWFSVVEALHNCQRPMDTASARFVYQKYVNPPASYSPKQQAWLTDLAERYLGLRV